jgi:hypothetical protein
MGGRRRKKRRKRIEMKVIRQVITRKEGNRRVEEEVWSECKEHQ